MKNDRASIMSQIYCRGELSEEERGAYKWWLFDVSECDDDTTDAERSVWSFSYLSVRGSLIRFL